MEPTHGTATRSSTKTPFWCSDLYAGGTAASCDSKLGVASGQSSSPFHLADGTVTFSFLLDAVTTHHHSSTEKT
jgi:hypothetical protein